MMQAVAESGAALQGASAVHLNVFGPNPIVVFGTEEQKKRILPDIIKGKVKGCFAVTEPDAGLNTTALETKAERDGNGYVVHGKKTWTTTAQVADKMLLIARTTPKDKCKRPTDGLSLFYTDLDRSKIEVREIEKMGRKAIDTNQLFIDGLKVPVEDRIGEEGKGFHYILHGMNPERILIAAEAIGIGQAALARPRQVRQGAHRVRPPDRPEPGDPAPAGRELDGTRGGLADGHARAPGSTTTAS
jgi:acyl-CoA dehydrogenase